MSGYIRTGSQPLSSQYPDDLPITAQNTSPHQPFLSPPEDGLVLHSIQNPPPSQNSTINPSSRDPELPNTTIPSSPKKVSTRTSNITHQITSDTLTFDTIPSEAQIHALARRIETRSHTALSDFNKLSLRLAKASNTSTYRSSTGQDIGYWENETEKKIRYMRSLLTTLYTIGYLLSQYPSFTAQQQQHQHHITSSDGAGTSSDNSNEMQPLLKHQIPSFEPDKNGKFPSLPPPHPQLTPKQLSYFRRTIGVINDFQTEFTRNSQLCTKSLDRMRLFLDVHDDGDIESGQSTTQLLNKEHHTLHAAIKSTNLAMSSAQATDSSLHRQRQLFSNILSHVASASERFPMINNALAAINNRRNRDHVILSTLIAFLLFLTVIYVLNKS